EVALAHSFAHALALLGRRRRFAWLRQWLAPIHDAQVFVAADFLEVLSQCLGERLRAGDAVVLLLLLAGANGLFPFPPLVRENVMIVELLRHTVEDFASLLGRESNVRLVLLNENLAAAVTVREQGEDYCQDSQGNETAERWVHGWLLKERVDLPLTE